MEWVWEQNKQRPWVMIGHVSGAVRVVEVVTGEGRSYISQEFEIQVSWVLSRGPQGAWEGVMQGKDVI